MKTRCHGLAIVVLCVLVTARAGICEDRGAVALPPDVKAVWELDKAFREKTPTRERICINGLWRWQPARNAKGLVTADNPLTGDISVPNDQWGYFKVPGNFADSMQTRVFTHPSWSSEPLKPLSAAWYEREITVPQEWAGRRISIAVEYLNSLATLYIDGKKAGKIPYPGGEVDITACCRPGQRHVLSALVFAEPMAGVMLDYSDSAAPKDVARKAGPGGRNADRNAVLSNRGLCGDVYLTGTPVGARITDVKIGTSFRNGEITIDTALQGLQTDGRYTLRARILDHGKTVEQFTGKPFAGADLKEGRMAIVEKWKADKLWDIHTPQNTYHLECSLVDAGGKDLDVALPERFGYREMWIEGRDFYLNGSRIFLAAYNLSSALGGDEGGAAWANYVAARETMERMKSIGINFVFTANFNNLPGAVISPAEVLRAADDVGMLIAFTQPHMGGYDTDWAKPAEGDRQSDYARHAAFYVHMAGNHPAVVFYSMNHNAGGYPERFNGDMEPDIIDGKYQPARVTESVTRMLRAQKIVSHLDPTRIIYHHASGNLDPALGSMHTSNFYTNMTPIQELSDWFQHWAAEGVKPVFLNEYGSPYPWDWTMYRGWYKGVRTFGSALVPWEFCLAEWDSQFVGDRAFQLSDNEKTNLRWEAAQFQKKDVIGWHHWDYPFVPWSQKLDGKLEVLGMYFTDNFRAYRSLGVSVMPAATYNTIWRLKDGVDFSPRPAKVDWENLQRPGFSPDRIGTTREGSFFYSICQRSDWIESPAAVAVKRVNMPLLAYIGGKAAQVTSKEHIFMAGEPVEKQLIVINNSREPVSGECRWSCALPQVITGSKTVSLQTGNQERIPLRFDLPAGTPPGGYAVSSLVTFSTGETQTDTFPIQVLAAPQAAETSGKIALFDPKGETGAWLKEAGITCQMVDARADLSSYDTLIVGKAALTLDGPAPEITRVRDGSKVIIFEQTSEVLEKRFGFRVVEYGLRNVFPRLPDHPLLAGLTTDHLRDWRGSATIVPGQLELEFSRKFFSPATTWCDISVPKIWRAGCRGNVASVLIEKPACGDFLPIVDGGFSLQYSPLMEYHEGKGLVIFCQMDVTGRETRRRCGALRHRGRRNCGTAWRRRRVARRERCTGSAGRMRSTQGGPCEAALFRRAFF
ncbi:MAG: beta-galactosidase [Chthoniobacter sp.]|nr:beta-galactosidase [Chthoniobacter sp.]